MAFDPQNTPAKVTAKALYEILEKLDQGIAVFDADGTLTLANSSFRKMYPDLADLLRPELPWTIFLREALSNGAMPVPVAKRLDEIESSLDYNRPSADPVLMPSAGGLSYALTMAATSDGGFSLTQSNIRDQSKEIDAAREAETLLRKVLEACPTSLTMSRVTDGQVIYRSPAATELLGSAKSSFSHFAQPEERADFVTALLPDARVDNMRVTGIRASGEHFPADLSARLIDYRGEDVIVSNIEDLTKELAVQAELDRQRDQLFQAEKLSALGELLAGIAHELNNPLSIIAGNAEILHEELENSPQERRVEKLSQAAQRCIRIVRSFLSLAREEPLDLKPLRISELVSNAVEAATQEAERANVILEVDGSQPCSEVIADEVQLTQVLINLLTNGVHAVRDSGVGDQVSIGWTCNGNTLCLRVADNGPGVPDDLKSRIFDPLFTTKQAGKGTGVGLAYCHRIITAHKGQIHLENDKAQGAAFVFELPLAR
ncbi:ATP-binding protein [Roseovarius rhodophyticola]|uniref:histidine kinase n=1 Tax=Roseovarius rhodophyticola TaxID=3080827 RepID=A0ABZ2TJX6_9RHOB|nr:ATP-binding protein [Roseovarius sp. W115]MDV2930290.1 ATP-binding protein [Roseovarius sp. W115]